MISVEGLFSAKSVAACINLFATSSGLPFFTSFVISWIITQSTLFGRSFSDFVASSMVYAVWMLTSVWGIRRLESIFFTCEFPSTAILCLFVFPLCVGLSTWFGKGDCVVCRGCSLAISAYDGDRRLLLVVDGLV